MFSRVKDCLGFGTLMFIVLTGCLLLGACAGPTGHRSRVLETPSEPAVNTRLIFYPQHGQTVQQQDRDRFECYLWAVEQSGFDPSSASLAPHQQIVVEADPGAGHDTVLGAAGGALFGAVAAGPRHVGPGMVLGGIAGALLGAVSDNARQQQATELQNQYNSSASQRNAALERRAEDYRRAMRACLVGRGYSVQ